jgi:hypothetical protein
MPKWFFGAYEAVDDAFALLQAYGLGIVQRRGAPPKRLQNQFFLTELGAQKADELSSTKGLDWYPQQAHLVRLVAGSDNGTQLKERQYAQDAYALATWGDRIGSVREQVEIRLADLRAQAPSRTTTPTGPAAAQSTAAQVTQAGVTETGAAGAAEEDS